MRRPRDQWLTLPLALAFFFGPALSLAFGVRPRAIENRRLADAPRLSQGWDVFPAIDVWATDHLPLRDRAVRTNTWASRKFLRELPSYGGAPKAKGVAGLPADTPPLQPPPRPDGGLRPFAGPAVDGPVTIPTVVRGRDDMLFFGVDFRVACSPNAWQPADVHARLGRLDRVVAKSGRRLVVVIPPNKSTIETESLPADFPGRECSAERRDAFWQQTARFDRRWYVDMRAPLEAARSRGELYRRSDTHWSPMSAAIYAEQLARNLDPRLWDRTTVRETGSRPVDGDLAALLGTPRKDIVRDFVVVRDGVTPAAGSTGRAVRNTTSSAPLFEPHTLFIGDSVTDVSWSALAPIFRSADRLKAAFNLRNQALLDALEEADVIVLEIVERDIVGGRAATLSDASLEWLEAHLH
ncbi:MAG: hypothetical protein ABIM89_15105 [Mycobacteriales bacterium]